MLLLLLGSSFSLQIQMYPEIQFEEELISRLKGNQESDCSIIRSLFSIEMINNVCSISDLVSLIFEIANNIQKLYECAKRENDSSKFSIESIISKAHIIEKALIEEKFCFKINNAITAAYYICELIKSIIFGRFVGLRN